MIRRNYQQIQASTASDIDRKIVKSSNKGKNRTSKFNYQVEDIQNQQSFRYF
jgi:hypothetical protein